MQPIDWHSMFFPAMNLFELIIRGTIMYLSIFFFLRIFQREAGSIGVADIVVVVIIADAAQNALGNHYESITEGLVLVATILFWNFMLDWLAHRFEFIRRLLEAKPMLLVKDGKVNKKNLRKEFITMDELMSQLRQNGLDSVEKVKLSYLEPDGKISVVPFET